MKNLKPILFTLMLFLLVGCSITKLQQKGTVHPESFNYEIAFTTYKTVIFMPVKINGESKNFLFDTGADFSVIQRDSTIGKTSNVSGASKRKMKMGEEYVKSMKIGDVEFKNTIAKNGNLLGLKEQLPNFGGLLGQPIINKANWLIDYPNKKMKISNQNIADKIFTTIKIKREGGAPYTYKRYTIGGLQTIKEKIGFVPLIKLGDIEFKNVSTKINVQSQPRIGIGFFKDCIIYIDNIENKYKIKK